MPSGASGPAQLSRLVAYASTASRWYWARPGAIASYAAFLGPVHRS
jgi:hypothetical protein